MSTKFLKLLPIVLAANISQAETPAAPAAEAAAADKPVAATPAAPYELKRKSEFNLDTRGRAPFWPIGWTKQGAAAPVVKKVDIDDDMFKVTSILVGNPSMAVINGRPYEEGQFIRMPKTLGTQLRPKLYRIGDGQVQIQVQSELVTVQLKRPELNAVTRDIELLNADKDDPLPIPSVTVKSASSR